MSDAIGAVWVNSINASKVAGESILWYGVSSILRIYNPAILLMEDACEENRFVPVREYVSFIGLQ